MHSEGLKEKQLTATSEMPAIHAPACLAFERMESLSCLKPYQDASAVSRTEPDHKHCTYGNLLHWLGSTEKEVDTKYIFQSSEHAC